eukprot:4980389-Amphidinium_carterae.1
MPTSAVPWQDIVIKGTFPTAARRSHLQAMVRLQAHALDVSRVVWMLLLALGTLKSKSCFTHPAAADFIYHSRSSSSPSTAPSTSTGYRTSHAMCNLENALSPTVWVLANVPNLMIFDDHDIRDDWGDRPEDIDKNSMDWFLASIAYGVILEYQRQLYEDITFVRHSVHRSCTLDIPVGEQSHSLSTRESGGGVFSVLLFLPSRIDL